MTSPTHLYLFNPDHDMALANQDVNYMAPAAARQLADDLVLLPAWYGNPQGFVLAPSAYNLSYLDGLREFFPDLPRLLTEPEVAASHGLVPSPWGWDPAVKKRLSVFGVSEDMLPSALQLEQIRCCSHRSLAVELLPALQFDHLFCGESFFFSSVDELKQFVEAAPACILKAPLSGSGKGLYRCKGVFTPHIHNWCLSVIKQQGGVVGEPLYDKAEDFAMEFYADESGHVAFCGYSLFSTNAGGAYEGNLLAMDAEIVRRLSGYVPAGSLDLLKERLPEELARRLQGRYHGYFGVDMMICRSSRGYLIHPCVEVNLRMNMGMVARLFYDRYVRQGVTGEYRVLFYPSNEALKDEHLRMQKEYPLEISGGRIVRGYLPLVPVTQKSRYRAFVCIGPLSLP